MKANIFNQENYQEIVTRIESLALGHQRRWGKMTLTQMLEHCSIQLRLGLGEIEQSHSEGAGLMRTRFGRWFVLDLIPWPKGLPTPAKMNMVKNETDSDDFQFEKQALLELLKEVQGKSHLKPHPFFGAMNQKDWGRLIWKHLDHHLRQFGG